MTFRISKTLPFLSALLLSTPLMAEVQSDYRSTTVWKNYDGDAPPAVPAGHYMTIPFMPVSETASAGSMRIAGEGMTASIHFSEADAKVVRIAAHALRDDVKRVTGLTPTVSSTAPNSGEAILIGSVGSSPLIDELVRSGKIDVSAISGKWEAYKAEVVENPLPGVSRALVIAGSDRRGRCHLRPASREPEARVLRSARRRVAICHRHRARGGWRIRRVFGSLADAHLLRIPGLPLRISSFARTFD